MPGDAGVLRCLPSVVCPRPKDRLQRRATSSCLPLAVNNCRFLLLPGKTLPNLGSGSLRLSLDRLSADWQARYGYPVALIATFVDPGQFCGTVYTGLAGTGPDRRLPSGAPRFLCRAQETQAALRPRSLP